MEVPFELSATSIEGIKLLNNEISEEITRKLIVNAVKQLLIKGPALPARRDIYNSDIRTEVQKADFGISTVLVIAAQHDIDSLKFKELLDFHKIILKTSSQLIESYDKFKDELKSRLEKCGNSHNILTLLDIEYEIQQKTIPTGDLIFKLTLKGIKDDKNVIEEFYCNNEELQLLISKFKDIERHCEKVSKSD